MCQLAPAAIRKNVLEYYKKMLTMAKFLPDQQRIDAIKNIRLQFRQNSSEGDNSRVQELLKNASSSLSYMKMVTPKVGNTIEGGVYKKRIGDVNNKGYQVVSNWHGGNMDPDCVRRHENTLKRAGFKNNAHAKGIF